MLNVTNIASFDNDSSQIHTIDVDAQTISKETLGDPESLAPAQLQRYQRPRNIFFPSRQSGHYLFNHNLATSLNSHDRCFSLPYCQDSEFSQQFPVGKGQAVPREILCTQVKFITHEIGKIYLEPAYQDIVPLWQPGDDQIVITTPFGKQYLFEGLKVRKTDHSVLDALHSLGYQTSLRVATEEEFDKLKTLEFVHYGHFVVADYNTGMSGIIQQEINKLVGSVGIRELTMERVFKAVTTVVTKDGIFYLDSVKLPIVITINGKHSFIWKQSYIDTCGLIAGESSYFGLCEAVGMPTTEKGLLGQKDKENMVQTLLEKRAISLRYFLYDLNSDIAVNMWNQLVSDRYQEMGLVQTKDATLTMGATVRNFRNAAICAKLGISSEDKSRNRTYPHQPQTLGFLIVNFIERSTAQYLSRHSATTQCLLAKVEGGTCKNDDPTNILTRTVADIDYKSAYGECQRPQITPFGYPEFIYYPIDSKVNEYMTLGEFVEFYKDELVWGAWQARVQTTKPLAHDQDLIASWFLDGKSDLNAMAKYIAKNKTDTELNSMEFNIDDGNLKYLNREFICSNITAPVLEWLQKTASPEQYKDIMSNTIVLSSMVYRKSNELKRNPGETYNDLYTRLEKGLDNHKGRNKWTSITGEDGSIKVIYVDGEYHQWFGVTEGELLMDDLIYNRAKHPKKMPDGSKNPENNTYKGFANTNFGNLVSPHFNTSNTVTGNNITAMCRTGIWYAAKGLNFKFRITDGGMIDLNRVCYPKKGRITGQNATNGYRFKNGQTNNIRYAPLAGYDHISFEWVKFEVTALKDGNLKTKDKFGCTLCLHKDGFTSKIEAYLKQNTDGTSQIVEPARDWINQKCLEHLQMLFPDVSILNDLSTSIKAIKSGEGQEWIKQYIPRKGLFEVEMKDFFDMAVAHGSSNYYMKNPNEKADEKTIAMRSYEKRTQQAYVLIDGKIVESDRYSVTTTPDDFLTQLMNNPTKIKRQQAFTKQAILKPKDYKNRLEHWQAMGLMPGDAYLKSGLLREFSLSEFTFPTLQMYKAWERQYLRLKDKYGQSFEMFFINDDGTLNYKKMISEIDALIHAGVTDPVGHLKKTYGHQGKQLPKNPHHPAFYCLVELKAQLGAEEGTEKDDFDAGLEG